MPKKSDYRVGLEMILNNPQTSFMKQPQVFHEIHKQSGMTMSQMMKTLGKTSKSRNGVKEETDEEKSEKRLASMKNAVEKNEEKKT